MGPDALAKHDADFRDAWRALIELTGPNPCLSKQPGNWERVIDFADDQKSLLLLARAVAASEAANVPDAASLRLKALAKAKGGRALMLAQETARLEQVMRQAGIATAVMKGAPLSFAVYGGVGARDPGDIDLLVPADQVIDAASLLDGMQYASDFRPLLDPPRQRERLMRVTNQMAFVNPTSGVVVELHWRWQTFEGMMPTSPNRIWGRSIAIPGLGEVSAPDGIEQFIYLCAHGLGHGWSRLKWLNDIRWILHNGSLVENDWDGVVARAEEVGMTTAVASAAMAAAKIDKLDLPQALSDLAARVPRCEVHSDQSLDWMLEQARSQVAASSPKNPIAMARGLLRHMKLSVADQPGSYRTRLRALFLPSPQEIALVDLPRGLGFGYAFIRAGRMMWRLFGLRTSN